MTNRPVILLDVDGVLNAVPHWDPTARGFQDFKMKTCATYYDITHSQQMADRLSALDADIVWLTTWEDRANEWIAPLFGWPELPVIFGGEEWYRPGWWKSTVAEKFIGEDPRPFIWIDDDLRHATPSELEWINWYDENGYKNLLVAPDTHVGITPFQIDCMEKFIEGLTAEAESATLVI